jgi:hypothetical protein
MNPSWSWEELLAAELTISQETARIHALEALRSLAVLNDDHSAFGVRLTTAITARFADAFGPMSGGWCWARDEGWVGGGVVSSWCCPRHSVPKREATGRLSETHALTVANAATAGLLEWFAFLRVAREEIAALRIDEDERTFLLGVARLTDMVVQATGCGDAWYVLAMRVVAWYLERCGVPSPAEVAAKALGGMFESWVAPPPSAVEEAARLLLEETETAKLAAKPTADAHALHIAAGPVWWCEPEDVAVRLAALPPLPSGFNILNAHMNAVTALDAPRSPERAAAMQRALVHIAGHAAGEGALTLDTIAAAHSLAMESRMPSALRTTTAYAKGGLERYGMPTSGTLDSPFFEQGLSPALECARLYLDVCFTHPFLDGNARAARLALAWLDVRHRIGFSDLVPAFTVQRVAGDAETGWGLARTLLSAAEAARRG